MPPSSAVEINTSSPRAPAHRRPCRSWRLQTCCCRAPLRTGCYIIGIWSICVTSLCLVIFPMMMLMYHHESHKKTTVDTDLDPTVLPTSTMPTLTPSSLPSSLAMVWFLLINCLYLIVSAIMLYGTVKKRPSLLSPWLYWSIGELIFMFRMLPILERTFVIILQIYCCIVVYSYIEELKDESRLSARREEGEEEMHATFVAATARQGRMWHGMDVISHSSASFAATAGGAATAGCAGAVGAAVPTHVFLPPSMTSSEQMHDKSGNSGGFYIELPPPYSPPLTEGHNTSTGDASGLPLFAEYGPRFSPALVPTSAGNSAPASTLDRSGLPLYSANTSTTEASNTTAASVVLNLRSTGRSNDNSNDLGAQNQVVSGPHMDGSAVAIDIGELVIVAPAGAGAGARYDENNVAVGVHSDAVPTALQPPPAFAADGVAAENNAPSILAPPSYEEAIGEDVYMPQFSSPATHLQQRQQRP